MMLNKKSIVVKKWLLNRKEKFILKCKKRRERRLNRIEKRASYLTKHPFIKKLWLIFKLIVIGIIISSFVYISITITNLTHNYYDSLKWTKITGPVLAKQDTELLYDNENHKKLKLELTVLMNEVWDFNDHIFTNKMTTNKIMKLKEIYQKISEPKTNLSEKYNEIMTFWEAHEQLASIFKDKKFTTIKNDVTIKQMSDVVDAVFDKIDDFLIKGDNYKQANNYRDIVYAIANDANTYASVLDQFSKVYNITKTNNQFTVKTDMSKKEFNNLKSTINKLNYKYDLMINFVLPIVNKSHDAVDKNTKNKNDFITYQNDLDLRNKFQMYAEQYRSQVNNLKSQLVTYENFKGHDIDELVSWANEHELNVKIKEQNSDKKTGIILSQTPSASSFNKIVKGSTIEVTISKEITSQSHSNNNSSSSDSSDNRSSSSSSSSSSNR